MAFLFSHRASIGLMATIVGGFCIAPAALPAASYELDPIIDSVIYTEPHIDEAPRVADFHPRLLPLWLEALQQPEVDYQRLAAQSIAMAHRDGMQELEQATELLIAKIEDPNQHPLVQRAAAAALVEMEVQQAAPQLMKLTETNQIDLQNIIEPALARWNYEPMYAVWLKRLTPAEQKTRQFRLAVQCLAVVKETSAVPALTEFALSKLTFPTVRVETATAAGQISDSGLEETARTLSSDTSSTGLVSRLAAVRLLSQHSSDAALEILTGLAKDSAPAVAASAWNRVNDLKPQAMAGQISNAVSNPDPEIRFAVVTTLASIPSAEQIKNLGKLLADPHDKVRRAARDALALLADDSALKETVLQVMLETIQNSDQWQGLEEAALLAGKLKEPTAGLPLIPLLSHEKPEVNISAAWALRRIQSPVTLPGIAQFFARQIGRAQEASLDRQAFDLQLTQLVQLVGILKFELAEEQLTKLISRNPFNETRAAAIWSLGQMHVGNLDEKLAERFADRLGDVHGTAPEDPRVRRAAAISIGLMKAESQLQALEEFYKWRPTANPVNSACRWAVDQILDEPVPEVGEFKVPITGWFLEPLN